MKSIFIFILTQVVSLTVLYLVRGYIFTQFTGVSAWLVYGFMLAVFASYFVYDLIALLKRRRLIKNFNW